MNFRLPVKLLFLFFIPACGWGISGKNDGTIEDGNEVDSTTPDILEGEDLSPIEGEILIDQQEEEGTSAVEDVEIAEIIPDEIPLIDGTDPVSDCLPNESPCTNHSECCSNYCHRAGVCMPLTGTCEPPGETCSSPAECCSGRCETGIDGIMRCQATGGCKGTGESCNVASDCCTLYCNEGTCSDGGTCALVGQSCTDDSLCCSNNCDTTTTNLCLDSPQSCNPFGETCAGPGNCCSGLCLEFSPGVYRCGGNFTCKPGGEACTSNGDCCNNACVEGYCAILTGCTVVGEPCTGGGECCSNACIESGAGVSTCQYLSGCRPIGEVCQAPEDCCSGLCEWDSHHIAQRCKDNPGCLRDGEVCFYAASLNCCAGHAACRPTLGGVYRCYNSDNPSDCLSDGAECAFSEECCCGLCAIEEATGTLKCCPGGIPCVPTGGQCTTDLDCCYGPCIDGICTEQELPCVPAGGHCTSDEDCCEPLKCNPSTQTCYYVFV